MIQTRTEPSSTLTNVSKTGRTGRFHTLEIVLENNGVVRACQTRATELRVECTSLRVLSYGPDLVEADHGFFASRELSPSEGTGNMSNKSRRRFARLVRPFASSASSHAVTL